MMPATPTTVTLDQAKDWAKRLQKNVLALSKLSDAQQAVAGMLGHASWHALTAFYKNDQAKPDVQIGTLWDEAHNPKNLSFDQMMESTINAINKRYPGINAVSVEVLAHEIDEIEGSPGDIQSLAQEIEDEKGYSYSDALEVALEESHARVVAPPGHMMIRVLDAEGKRFMTVMEIGRYG